MKKALILGTNAGQADIIRFLNDNNWETHSCGYKAIGPGVTLADYFHLVNITDLEAVKDLARTIQADIVYSVSSDIAITTATKVSEQLNLPVLLNSEIIDLFNQKSQFREFLNKHNIGTVNFKTVNTNNFSQVIWNDFPCVVKPVDSQGQRGVQLVKHVDELQEALSEAVKYSTDGEAIIEEFLDGSEISTNVIVQNGVILINEFSDRIVFGTDYFGLPKGHGLPVTYLTNEQLDIANGFVDKIVNNLEIKDAVLYIQMKLLGNEPRVIEIAPRLDGCHIWKLIKHYRNVDLRELAIKCLLKEPIDISSYNKNPIVNQSILQFHHLPTEQKFFKENLLDPENLVYEEFRYEDGEEIVPINGRLEVVGYYIYDNL